MTTTREADATDVPRNPLRALVSADLWITCSHLAIDAVAAIAGLAVLATLAVGVLLIPVALAGVPVTVAAGRVLFRLAAAERPRFATICGITTSPPPGPALSRSLLRSASSLARDRHSWRQAGYSSYSCRYPY